MTCGSGGGGKRLGCFFTGSVIVEDDSWALEQDFLKGDRALAFVNSWRVCVSTSLSSNSENQFLCLHSRDFALSTSDGAMSTSLVSIPMLAFSRAISILSDNIQIHSIFEFPEIYNIISLFEVIYLMI